MTPIMYSIFYQHWKPTLVGGNFYLSPINSEGSLFSLDFGKAGCIVVQWKPDLSFPCTTVSITLIVIKVVKWSKSKAARIDNFILLWYVITFARNKSTQGVLWNTSTNSRNYRYQICWRRPTIFVRNVSQK